MSRFLPVVLALAFHAAAWAQTATPAGVWTTFSDRTGQPDGLVRIEEMDGEFLGTVVAVFSPPAPSPDPVCNLCQDELKDKPVVGMKILRGLRRDGEGFAGGTILDPNDGRSYQCLMRLLDDGRRLEVRGYIGMPMLGRSQTWVRKE